ncbi:hypothetical protein Cni_G00882 [Canna indica]|uniref:Uncharacterized protein n=1 Tax=Canna indica TaxID=4628 RepID=A0AAQ3JM33_9LILI|nr:hypothetical protein Cni_G00882 [Canna indica]
MDSSSVDTDEWTIVDAKDSISDVDAAAGNLGSKSPSSGISVWTMWVLGSVIGLAVPLYRKILWAEEAVENAVESTAEAVGKIAEVTEKIVCTVSDELPDGSLKKKALQMEEICEKIDNDAEVVEDFVHKVDQIKEEVDAIVEPIIEKGEEIEKKIQEKETE